MPHGFICPLCGSAEAGIPARGVTICEQCGVTIDENAPRMLLVAKAAYHTFCSPDCLKIYQTVDELYTKKGSTRESPD